MKTFIIKKPILFSMLILFLSACLFLTPATLISTFTGVLIASFVCTYYKDNAWYGLGSMIIAVTMQAIAIFIQQYIAWRILGHRIDMPPSGSAILLFIFSFIPPYGLVFYVPALIGSLYAKFLIRKKQNTPSSKKPE